MCKYSSVSMKAMAQCCLCYVKLHQKGFSYIEKTFCLILICSVISVTDPRFWRDDYVIYLTISLTIFIVTYVGPSSKKTNFFSRSCYVQICFCKYDNSPKVCLAWAHIRFLHPNVFTNIGTRFVLSAGYPKKSNPKLPS